MDISQEKQAGTTIVFIWPLVLEQLPFRMI